MPMQLKDVQYKQQPCDQERKLGQLKPGDASLPSKKRLSGSTASELIADLFRA